VVIGGNWVVLKEEGGDRHIATSQEGLETWIKYKKDESGSYSKLGVCTRDILEEAKFLFNNF